MGRFLQRSRSFFLSEIFIENIARQEMKEPEPQKSTWPSKMRTADPLTRGTRRPFSFATST